MAEGLEDGDENEEDDEDDDDDDDDEDERESQRDSETKPRVARNSLPWENATENGETLKGLWLSLCVLKSATLSG